MKSFGFIGLLNMRFLGCVACDLPFTLSFLCNEVYINKIGLFPSIFVPNPLVVSCMVHSQYSVCDLQKLIVAFRLVCKDT